MLPKLVQVQAIICAMMLVVSFSHAQDVPTSRGYLTTPAELHEIARKAEAGIEPYASAVQEVLDYADESWDFEIGSPVETCRSSDRPAWIDEQQGVPILYGKALAYHLTGEEHYAAEVKQVLEAIMENVIEISLKRDQCRLNFGWGIPEYVAAADLIEDYWYNQACRGPVNTVYGDDAVDLGNCKRVFQNWLVKNPYYVISYSAFSQSNWGAAATNATAYIADYLWDRPDISLIHRQPEEIQNGEELVLTPAEAYAFANELMFRRLNGYGVDYDSSFACDYLEGEQQLDDREPVKSQITPAGIIPDDARREQHCNIEQYNGEYQNYPQISLNNTTQQCELMLRRGDSSCYDNIDMTDVPDYTYLAPDGEMRSVHLRPGRGSIERAINAVIVDSGTEWKHDSALMVAYRYYVRENRFGQVDAWREELDGSTSCSQGVCFGYLTHGFASDETPESPPTVPPPGEE